MIPFIILQAAHFSYQASYCIVIKIQISKNTTKHVHCHPFFTFLFINIKTYNLQYIRKVNPVEMNNRYYSSTSSTKYDCFGCKKTFVSQRALSVHLAKSTFCIEFKNTTSIVLLSQYGCYRNTQPEIKVINDFGMSTLTNAENFLHNLNGILILLPQESCTTQNTQTTSHDDTSIDIYNNGSGTICEDQPLACH